MRKLFLIPFMSLLTCVMAWATDVNDAASFKAAWEDPSTTSIRLENSITVSGEMVAAGNFTVDFNGHTITAGDYTLCVGGNYDNKKLYNNVVTFIGEGGITAGEGCLDVYSKVVINGGNFKANTQYGIYMNGAAELEMNGGSITAPKSAIVLSGTATITDGSIKATASGNLIYAINMQSNSNSHLEISGGSINAAKCTGIRVPAGCELTFSNGEIVTGQNGIYMTGGTLTVNNGSISSGDYYGIQQLGGIATIKGGTIYGRNTGIVIVNNTSELNIHGGTIEGDQMAISGNGTAKYWGTTINIDGGTIGSESTAVAIYHPQAGTLNITDGTITGQMGIGMKGGTLNISGGTIHAVGSNGGRVEGYNNGINPSFAAVQIESNPGYAGNMNITISDNATLISDSWYAFYEYLSNPDAATKVNSIAVTGGHFQGGILLSQDLNAKGGFVSGGKWSVDVTANVVKGKVANPIDEDPYFFEVGDPTPATAEIVNDPSKNAVLTNEDGETYAGSYTSETVGDDAEVKTSTATNQVVVSENTDVVVDKTDENNSTIVEVKKVTVEGDAQLSVKEGATLMVGTGSVLLDENTNTGGLTVEAGAALVVEGLVYGSTEDNFVIEGQEDKSGIVLFSPETEFIREDHPTATYRFTSKSFRDGSKWVYQRFGMPSFDGTVTVKSGNLAVNSYICTWDYATDDWGAWSPKIPEGGLVYAGEDKAVPFQCYQLGSTNAKDAPVTYDFVVELMGNANAPLNFKAGWNPYANSYTAPIDIKEFLTDVIAANGSDILATIYLYKDLGNDTYTWQGINLSNVGKTYRVRENGAMVKKTYDASIEPMQAFIMKLSNGDDATTDINYLNNVYNPAMGIDRPASAPARSSASYNEMQIGAYNDMYWDNISVMEGEQFSAAEDNGYDAPKYDHNKGLSLYVINGEQHMERMATDNADGMFIGINAPVAGTYTLDFSGIEGMNYSLIDMTNNTVVEIVEDGQYNFYAEAGQNDYRFQLVAPARVPTAIENVNAKASAKGVYSISGQYLGENINALPKGVYIINGAKVVK